MKIRIYEGNPAEGASQGLDVIMLNEQHRCMRGPRFLWQPEKDWPAQQSSPNEDPEIKRYVNVHVTTIRLITFILRNKVIPGFFPTAIVQRKPFQYS